MPKHQRKTILLPRWSEERGWRGGEKDRLYLFTDTRTGQNRVMPVYACKWTGPPAVEVRPATRTEATRPDDRGGWQEKLHSGWKVVEE